MRTDGYAPIRDYALIGDGRTCALVALDGSIDWLCLPEMDSPSTFGALLDPERGGRFALAPEEPFDVERRYVPGTNVLETVFRTAEGAVRVTDALTLPSSGLEPLREVVRRVEGLAGSVTMKWSVEPRFDYGRRDAGAGEAVAVRAWGAEGGTAQLREGEQALLVLTAAKGEPLVLPSREDAERRLDETVEFWRRWTSARSYDGPWKDEVLRSALVLKLLAYAPSGAMAAAPTTSLPEDIGGERNWDYRFCWVRDTAFAVDALLDLGCHQEGEAFFWWLMHASQRTHPELNPLFRLNGDVRARERELGLAGYRGSRPVRVGNGAVDQLQLGIYGSLIETVALYVHQGFRLDRDTAGRVAETADLVCEIWPRRDAGIWEVRSDPVHFTHSKVNCWVALDRAVRLAEEGHIPGEHAGRWREAAGEVQEFIERECWSEPKRSYVRSAGVEELDAALLMAAIMGYPNRERVEATVDAIRRELGRGALVYRYLGEDGLPGEDGAFLACSFWLAHALAELDRKDEAAELMDELVGLANDVGLYSEEIDPGSGEFLGNFPQALSHLALINAAAAIAE
jgi:GH15 family glucan-1,4-alpha-glucosidase